MNGANNTNQLINNISIMTPTTNVFMPNSNGGLNDQIMNNPNDLNQLANNGRGRDQGAQNQDL